MTEFSLSPLTPVELWQLVAVVIVSLFLASVCMVGLWTLFRTEPRENKRLSRIQHLVRWLGRHGKAWRILCCLLSLNVLGCAAIQQHLPSKSRGQVDSPTVIVTGDDIGIGGKTCLPS